MSERPAQGVRPLVRRAWHAVGMTRTVEAIMLGLGVGLLAAAAAVVSGAEAGERAIWIAALLGGVPMGTAWLVEMRPRASGVARRIDQRLNLGGALVAAWEVENDGRSGRLGHLLGRRLRGRLRVRGVLAAAVPNSTPLVAVPLLGVAALVLALEARPVPVDPLVGLGGVIEEVTGALAEAREGAMDGLGDGEVAAADVEEFNRLVSRSRALSRESEHVGRDPAARERVSERVRDLADDLERAADRHRDRPEVARPLERALALTDSARLACRAAREREGSADPGPGSERPLGPEPAAETGPGTVAEGGGPGAAHRVGDEDDAGALANDGAEGTMAAPPGPEPVVDAVGDPLRDPGPGAEAGVALGPWWPDRHAGVVRRFVERRRGADSSSE